MTIANWRKRRSVSDEISPSQPNTKRMSGIWNTRPKAMISLRTIIAFGLVFQIPLLLFVLGWLGVVTSDTLRSFRKFAIVIAFFLGMALTPPDPMSQIMMALPLCLFYEMSVWGVWLKEKLDFTASSEKKEDTPPAADTPATEAPPAGDASGEGGEGA